METFERTRANHEPLREHGRRVQQDLRRLSVDVQGAVGEVGRRFLVNETERRPYVTLAAAIGIGALLGRGSPRTARALLRLGARLTTAWVARSLLTSRTR